MSKDYNVKDAAKDTNVSSKHASGSWHQARDDAASGGDLSERNWNKLDNSPIKDFFSNLFGWEK